MAYDGIITYAITKELAERITLGKIEKVYQPGSEELLIHIHTRSGNVRLFISCNSQSARVCLTTGTYVNPDQPPTFCMLLRKHLQGGRITEVRQKGSERIIEIDIEAQNELGFSVSRRLIVEIMAKHSNIVLVDIESGRIIDSIKRISIDVNRYRQLLPGITYQYPPAQDKIPFRDVTGDLELPHDDKALMNWIGGISPAISRELVAGLNDQHDARTRSTAPTKRLLEIIKSIDEGVCVPHVYMDTSVRGRRYAAPAASVGLYNSNAYGSSRVDASGSGSETSAKSKAYPAFSEGVMYSENTEAEIGRMDASGSGNGSVARSNAAANGMDVTESGNAAANGVDFTESGKAAGVAGTPREFHVADLSEYEDLERLDFGSVSECVEFFFSNREVSNLVRQKSMPLLKSVQASLGKALLKKKKLAEDLLSAENSDKYRLYGELLTANIHAVKPGARKVTVTNYYDGSLIDIPLDEKIGASANAQRYFKKYSKARTAIHEKQAQLEDNEKDIAYLESVIQTIEAADTVPLLESIRDELESTGYVKRRAKAAMRKRKAAKPEPLRYRLSDGTLALVGRNNTENDWLSMKYAAKTDVWLHTKDIPGSHVILKMEDGRTLQDLQAEIIYEAASLAAYHSKAASGSNVPVDYVPVRYVKKPNGAKPGMVIFTHNQTVYVDPKLPAGNSSK